jgi:G3E family GTPase
MQLNAVLPNQRSRNHRIDLPEMLTNCLLAACQHQEFKRLVGWKGMAVCPRGSQGWTLKIRARAGVFGLGTEHTWEDEQGQHARLGVYHFPAAEEPLLETMSLAANHAAAQPDYLETVRRFTSMDDWATPFRMGVLTASLAPEEKGLILQCEALNRKLSIARDGVKTPEDKWIIYPGEAEENFPAHDIAQDFLLVLAAAITNSLEEPPCRAGQSRIEDNGILYDGTGRRSLIGDGIERINTLLCWGDRETLAAMASLSLAQCKVTAGPDSRAKLPAPLDNALFWKTHDLDALSLDRTYAPAFDSRPGLIVLSGFLGSGKTTFLNQLLEYHAARDELVAIIQNEIGQTGVDGKLLEGDDSIVELDEGCVCCTLAGNLSKGIEQLKTRFSPKVIVLEATGLANPFNILNELETLRPLVRLDSVTTLVDAANAPGLLANNEIARDQIASADTLILNKCDLTGKDELATLRATLRKLNHRAVLVETEFGSANPGHLYDTDPFEQRPSLLPAMPHTHHHDHSREGFTSQKFLFSSALDRGQLLKALDDLPESVFRLKGIVHLADSPQPVVVQYVCGRHELSSLGAAFDQDGFLVAIGKGLADLPQLKGLQGAYA